MTTSQLLERGPIVDLVEKARAAQQIFGRWSQEAVDHVVAGVAWAGYRHADRLARLAVEETGLGNYEDKLAKNRRKTLGTLRDLRGAPSVGIIKEDSERGITEIAKPVGVVAAMTPLTNPGATVINNAMIVLKGRNAVILAPHPHAERTCAEFVTLARRQLQKIGAPLDLVQHCSLAAPDKAQSKALGRELMRAVDLVLVTSGPSNVRDAYSSGTPALGVGVGNVPVIVDASADIEAATAKIVRSKTFDHATSCSSENSLIIEEGIYDAVVASLRRRGGYLITPAEKTQLQDTMWRNGTLNREVIAQSAGIIVALAGISAVDAATAKFLVVEEEGIGPEYPFSGEKLSPVLTMYRFATFDEALDKVRRILAYQGRGHSCGIHSHNDERVLTLADSTDVARVLVNQPHGMGNGGDFENGLPFSLSLGAGTWAHNSTCDNISYKHFLNVTRIVRPMAATIPTERELWNDYLTRYPDPPDD